MAIISTEVLAALIRARIPMAILDARRGKWDDGRRIPGARSLSLDAPEDAVSKALPDKEGLIVTYCGGMTCPLSYELAERLGRLGYRNVLTYQQGLAGWSEAGHPVEWGRAAA
jgi:rhodanese-related sulfurtransferase